MKAVLTARAAEVLGGECIDELYKWLCEHPEYSPDRTVGIMPMNACLFRYALTDEVRTSPRRGASPEADIAHERRMRALASALGYQRIGRGGAPRFALHALLQTHVAL